MAARAAVLGAFFILKIGGVPAHQVFRNLKLRFKFRTGERAVAADGSTPGQKTPIGRSKEPINKTHLSASLEAQQRCLSYRAMLAQNSFVLVFVGYLSHDCRTICCKLGYHTGVSE